MGRNDMCDSAAPIIAFAREIRTVVCRELTRNSQPVINKKYRKHMQKKTITCTKQYLSGLAICLRPRSCRDFTIIKEKYKYSSIVFYTLSRRQQ